MNWKNQMAKAIVTLRTAADGEAAQSMAGKARQLAAGIAQRAKVGALDAAQAFVEANADPAAFKCQFLNAKLSVLAPSNGLEIARPSEGTIVISDGENNGLLINAAASPAYVAETIGKATRLDANTFDLGDHDGINVVILEP